jgi:hypothetical protein
MTGNIVGMIIKVVGHDWKRSWGDSLVYFSVGFYLNMFPKLAHESKLNKMEAFMTLFAQKDDGFSFQRPLFKY